MTASLISFKCPSDLKSELDSLADACNVSRSQIIKQILEQGVVVQRATYELINSEEGKKFVRDIVEMEDQRSRKPARPKNAKKKKTKKTKKRSTRK